LDSLNFGCYYSTGTNSASRHKNKNKHAGEFAETIRDQFLQERIEFFAAVEQAVYVETEEQEECTKAQFVSAFLAADLDATEMFANKASGFPPPFSPILTLITPPQNHRLLINILKIPCAGLHRWLPAYFQMASTSSASKRQ
jgi:hypothetical protein